MNEFNTLFLEKKENRAVQCNLQKCPTLQYESLSTTSSVKRMSDYLDYNQGVWFEDKTKIQQVWCTVQAHANCNMEIF